MNTHIKKLDNLKVVAQDGFGIVAESALEWEWEVIDDTDLSAVQPDYHVTIPIQTSDFDLDLAIALAEVDAKRVAHKLLMFDDDEELPSDVDLADTICEVANISAGEIKKILYQFLDSVSIGIPTLPENTDRLNTPEDADGNSTFLMQLGPTTVQVVLSTHQKQANLTTKES